MSEKYLTRAEVLGIPADDCPLLVLSFNYRSFISAAINIRKKSSYNHLMWYCRPGRFASQGIFFQEENADDYLDHHRLKFWTCSSWVHRDRNILRSLINEDLRKPKFKTRYDFLAILGQLIGLSGLQIPWTRICSDYAGYLSAVDPDYTLKHPAPGDVNTWLKSAPGYKVYGRYIPD